MKTVLQIATPAVVLIGCLTALAVDYANTHLIIDKHRWVKAFVYTFGGFLLFCAGVVGLSAYLVWLGA